MDYNRDLMLMIKERCKQLNSHPDVTDIIDPCDENDLIDSLTLEQLYESREDILEYINMLETYIQEKKLRNCTLQECVSYFLVQNLRKASDL